MHDAKLFTSSLFVRLLLLLLYFLFYRFWYRGRFKVLFLACLAALDIVIDCWCRIYVMLFLHLAHGLPCVVCTSLFPVYAMHGIEFYQSMQTILLAVFVCNLKLILYLFFLL